MKRKPLIAAAIATTLVVVLLALWLRPIPEDVEPPPVMVAPVLQPAPIDAPRTTPELVARTQRAAQADPAPVVDRETPSARIEPSDTGEPVADEIRLTATVSDSDGYPVDGARLVMRGDCGRRVFPLPMSEVTVTLPTGLCSLYALRRDGALRAYSDTVEILGEPGDSFDISLVVPAERTGGIGVQFRPVDGAMEVTRVVPGSPADRAGLRTGDLITEVDGVPVDGLSMRDFVKTMTGPEGTDVDFRVRYPNSQGSEDALTVTRSFLDG